MTGSNIIIFLFLNYSSSDVNGCVNCPSPWILVKGSCIQYLGNGSVLSWNQARSKCQAIGADLMDVNFDTFFEYAETFIDTFLNNTNFPTFYVKKLFYIYIVLKNNFLIIFN
jgi:hypothetical protein